MRTHAIVLALAIQIAEPSVSIGIHPLTEATLRDALQVERLDQIPSSVFTGDAPWTVSLVTPFGQAASIAADAKRQYLPVPTLTLHEIDNSHVVVQVKAGDRFTQAEDVTRVVLKRAQAVIQPVQQRVQPRVVQNALGASRTVNEGSFVFPIDAFAPTEALTIVVIGDAHTIELPLSAAMLGQFR